MRTKLITARGGGRLRGEEDYDNGRFRVLVVDDDRTCLRIIEKMLQSCHYQVTTTSRAVHALAMLREKKKKMKKSSSSSSSAAFDLVISDLHMPDMDGFKLLEHIGLEMNLPVIMMSADDERSVIMKGVIHGACDYLIKPIRIEMVKNIWQHVVRKRRNEIKDMEIKTNSAAAIRIHDDQNQIIKPVSAAADAYYANDGTKNSKRRKEADEIMEEDDQTSLIATKKQRVVWSFDLHKEFVDAVNLLGVEKAVPKKILELMNVPWITRENVASHLQKYRLCLKRLNGGASSSSSQHQIASSTQFMTPPRGRGSSVGELPLFEGLNLHDFSLSDMPPHGGGGGGVVGQFTTNSGIISLPFIDQQDSSTSSTPNSRFGVGRQFQYYNNNNNNNTMNLQLNGYPTTATIDIGGRQQHLAYLRQTFQSFGTMVGTQVDSVYRNQQQSSPNYGTPLTGVMGTFHNQVPQPSSVYEFPTSTSGGGMFQDDDDEYLDIEGWDLKNL